MISTPVKLIVLLRPYLESNAEATAFLTSADISAAHLSPIEAFVPSGVRREEIMKMVDHQKMDGLHIRSNSYTRI